LTLIRVDIKILLIGLRYPRLQDKSESICSL